MKVITITLGFILVSLLSHPTFAQSYAQSWAEITEAGDTIQHTWPPPDSIYLHDVVVVKFRRGALDNSMLCYDCDTIVPSGVIGDTNLYFPTCKETLMTQHLPLSVVLDAAVLSVFTAHGATYFTRLTAASPCRDTLSITRNGDTIPMDDYDWLDAHFNNDTSVLKTLVDLYAPDSSGMEIAEPVYLGVYAKNPHDPWAWTWPHLQKSLDMIGVNSAWDWEVGGPEHSVVAVIDNGLDYWRCDLGGGAIPNSKVIGGWDFAGFTDDCPTTGTLHGPSMQGIFHGLCSSGADHGTPIASIIGAYTNNYTCGGVDQGSATGMAGIAGGWGPGGGFSDQGTGCKLIGYMVTDSSTCSKPRQAPRSDWIAAAMLEASAWATAPLLSGHYGYGANIINMSWYFQYSLPLAIRSAVASAYAVVRRWSHAPATTTLPDGTIQRTWSQPVRLLPLVPHCQAG